MLGLSLGVPFKGMVSAAPAVDTTSFITTWTATSAELLKPSTNSGGTYSGTIQWEELGGTVLSGPTAFSGYNDSNLGYTTAGAGTVRCRISGTFSQFDAANNSNSGTPSKIKAVEQFGSVGWLSLNNAFKLSSLESVSFVNSDFSTLNVNSALVAMFRECHSLSSVDFTGFGAQLAAVVDRMATWFYGDESISSIDMSPVVSFENIYIWNFFCWGVAGNYSFVTNVEWDDDVWFPAMDGVGSLDDFMYVDDATSQACYGDFLNRAWAYYQANGVPGTVNCQWQNIKYPASAATARAALIATAGWTIADAGAV